MKQVICLLSLLLSLPALAAPECDYNFNVSNATIQVTTDPQVIQVNYTISRRTGQDQRCENYRIFFSKGQANSYQRKAYFFFFFNLNYNLHSNINQNGVLKDFNDALSPLEYVSGSMPQSNTNYTGSFFISVPAVSTQTYSASGTYNDSVQISIYGYKPQNGQYSFESTNNFAVSLIVNKKIDVSVIDEGSPFDANSTSKVLDFGNLEINSEKGADIRVVSNTPYQIKVSSQNNGKMVLNSSTVNYQMKSNGSTVSLGSSQSNPVSIGSGNATNSAGDRYNVRFKITEDVENKASGLYQDVITITTLAN